MNKQALFARIGSRMNALGLSADFTGAVFVDGTGVGWGHLGCPNLVSVDFGARPDRTDAATPRRATPTSAPRCASPEIAAAGGAWRC
jgi:hypothetical protein